MTPEPMTPERLAEIRQRLDRKAHDPWAMASLVEELLAEVDRLTAERDERALAACEGSK